MAKRSKNRSRSTTSSAKPAKAKATVQHRQPPDRLLLILASVGMVITAYLTLSAWWDATPAFCTEGSSCDVIQQSRWSTVLGLPLALWGLLLYGLIAFFAYRPLAAMKRWKRIWSVALIGLVMSLYLTIVGMVELNAVCLWCLASLATLGAIFISNALRRPAGAPEMPWWNWWLNSGVAAIVAAVALHLYYNSDMLTPPPDPRLEPLTEHLQQTGAKFYGASWCTSCQRQKQVFGDLADQLPYVECSPFGRGGPTAAACTQMEIQNFPTWIIDGERYIGVLQPEELAEHSGFEWE